MEWSRKSVLVTGGSRGIGFATAQEFLSRGASVTISGRDEDGLRDAARRLGSGANVATIRADVSTVAGCRTTVAAALDAFGFLDVLFTNAGGYESAPLEEMSEQLWDRTMDTHVKGTVFCVQAAVPALRERRGVVVAMASDCGFAGLPGGWSAYCAAMGAVVNLVRQLAIDLAPEVRVNAVAPGPTSTERLMGDVGGGAYGTLGQDADPLAALYASVPLRRVAEPAEIARAVVFVAGSPTMTGAALSIDGGTTAGLP